MGKRKADNLLSPSEIRQSTQHHYEGYIKADQKQKKINPIFTERPHYGIPDPKKATS